MSEVLLQGGPDASKGVFAQTDGEPYFVDHLGFHEDVHYKVNLRTSNTYYKFYFKYKVNLLLFENPYTQP